MLSGRVACGGSGVVGSLTSTGGMRLARLSCDSCGSIVAVATPNMSSLSRSEVSCARCVINAPIVVGRVFKSEQTVADPEFEFAMRRSVLCVNNSVAMQLRRADFR